MTFSQRCVVADDEDADYLYIPKSVLVVWRAHRAKVAEGGLGWGQNHRGSGDGRAAVGSRGGAPVWGLVDDIPQKLKNF